MSILTDAQGTRTHRAAFRVAQIIRVLATPAVFSALACLFYWKLVFGGLVLASYDLFTYFYPYKANSAAAIAADRLPLWNPNLFMGVPFLANIQTAVLYPPNLVDLVLLPPIAVTASIVFHVVLAGLFMYVFLSYSVNVSRHAAFLGGLVFMFSGFLGQQVGHINQLNASIWLPLLLATFDWAHRQRSILRTLLAGVILAFALLAGHSQESFLIGAIFAGYIVFRLVLMPVTGCYAGSRHSRSAGRFSERLLLAANGRVFLLSASVMVLAIGAALAAVQLLPTYELSKESIRSGGLPYVEAVSFSLSPLLIARSLLPGYLSNPFSEYIGYIGVAPLLLAILAVVGRARNRFVWFAVLVAVTAVLLAMGGYTPFYHVLYDHIPGFDLFRVPARWLYAYTFAASMLVGLGADKLLHARGPNDLSLGSRLRTQLLFLVVLGIFGSALWAFRDYLLPPTRETPHLWLLFGSISTLLIVAGMWRLRGSWLTLPMGCLFFGELMFAAQGLELNQPLPLETYTTLPPSVGQMLTRAGNSRILSISPGEFMPGDERELHHMLEGTLPDDQIQDYLVTLKYSQTLAPNLPMRFGLATIDGYDGGVLPLRRYAQLKQMIAMQVGGGATRADQADAPLRLQLSRLPDSELLGMLSVKYVLADKTEDLWQDGVYYDLALRATSTRGSTAVLDGVPGFRATSLRLLSHIEGDDRVAPGEEIARLVVQADDGGTYVLPIRAGMESDWLPPQNSGPLSELPPARTVELPAGQTYLSALSLNAPTTVRQVHIRSTTAAVLQIDGLSFVDDRLGLSEPSVSNGKYRRVYSGDVKIYENLDARERLYLVQHASIGRTDAETLDLLARHPANGLVLSELPGDDWQNLIRRDADSLLGPTSAPEQERSDGSTANPTSSPGSVSLLVDLPELRRAAVTTEQPAFLVFAESSFPGWQARLNGQSTQLVRANHLFQAVYIPSGSHVVDFVYNPPSLRLGWAVSATALVLVAGMFCLTSVNRLLRRARHPSARSYR